MQQPPSAGNGPLRIGEIIDDRYEIVGVIGRGGCGIVYRGVQRSTGQNVAIKVLSGKRVAGDRADNERARFEREMSLIGQLQHPNIVRLIDSGTLVDGEHYTVLEYIRGHNLEEYIAEHGQLDIREAIHLMSQVLDALASAHEMGVVHRDLKPTNIMVTLSGARRNAMVLDFGVAGIMEQAQTADYRPLTMMGNYVGTPAYMSPEQIRGEDLSARSDIYSWGLVLLECITGRKALSGDSNAEILAQQVAESPVQIPPSLDRDLRRILEQCVAKIPELRYPSALEAMDDLAVYRPPAQSADHGPTRTVRVTPGDLNAVNLATQQHGPLEDEYSEIPTQAMQIVSDQHPAIRAARHQVTDPEELVNTAVVPVMEPDADNSTSEPVSTTSLEHKKLAERAEAELKKQDAERSRSRGSTIRLVFLVILLLAAAAIAVLYYLGYLDPYIEQYLVPYLE